MSIEEAVESLSQRELRNESGRVFRAVAAGQSFILTNNRTPVGRIVPLEAPPPGLPIVRPAVRRGGWATLGVKRRSVMKFDETLADLREDRL